MKYLLVIIVCILMSACHADENDLFTEASISLCAGDTIDIERIQGTVSLTNLNTRQLTRTTDISGNKAEVTLLRGAYSIQAEGYLQYVNKNNETIVRQFRAYSDYAQLEQTNRCNISLSIIFM